MEQSLKKEREQKGESIPILTVSIDNTLDYLGYLLSLSENIPSNSVSYNINTITAYCGDSTYYALKW